MTSTILSQAGHSSDPHSSKPGEDHGVSEPQEWFASPTQNETVSYHTQRQRVLSPGEIANLPHGKGLLLQGADWRTIKLTPWYETEPWRRIGATARDSDS